MTTHTVRAALPRGPAYGHVAQERFRAISTSCTTPWEHSECSQGVILVRTGVLRVLPLGQERFRAISTSYIRDVHAVVLIYDVTNDATFKNTRTWMRVRTAQRHTWWMRQ